MVHEVSVARAVPRSRAKALSAKDLLSVDPAGVAIRRDFNAKNAQYQKVRHTVSGSQAVLWAIGWCVAHTNVAESTVVVIQAALWAVGWCAHSHEDSRQASCPTDRGWL